MTSLTRFDSNGLELVIDIVTGEVFASIRAVARMCNRGETTIRDFLGARNFELKSAEILTPGGLQGARLLNEDQILDVIDKYKPELVINFAKLGLRASLHKLAGYTVTSTAVETIKIYTTIERTETVNKLASSLTFFGITPENPRFKQGLQDLVGDILGLSQPLLESNDSKWLGCVERAEQLGYPVSVATHYRSALGTFVKKAFKNKGLEFKEENRLCNGTQRTIALYQISDDFDNAIKQYMDKKINSI